jgi:hypothetical protein
MNGGRVSEGSEESRHRGPDARGADREECWHRNPSASNSLNESAFTSSRDQDLQQLVSKRCLGPACGAHIGVLIALDVLCPPTRCDELRRWVCCILRNQTGGASDCSDGTPCLACSFFAESFVPLRGCICPEQTCSFAPLMDPLPASQSAITIGRST